MWKIVLLLVFVTSSSFSIPAQEKEISPQDFVTIRNRDFTLRNANQTPYREKMTTEKRISEDGQWEFYSYQVTEYVNPGKVHNIQYTGLKLETIGIADDIYSKAPDQPWVHRKRVTGIASSAPVTFPSTGPTTFQYKILRTEVVDGRNTMVVREVAKEQRAFKGVPVEFVVTRHYWIDDNGLIVKRDDEALDPAQKTYIRHTYILEWDPSIKIEAPLP